MTVWEKRQVVAEADHYAKREQCEWARIREAAAMIGIKRSRFYEMLGEAKGKVRTLVLKSPGATNGARLIHIPSLLGYLDSMAANQQGGQS
jgi:hypothetical protein